MSNKIKIKIRKSDKRRVILTDVLPYGYLYYFPTEGFYRFIKENENTENFNKLEEIISPSKNPTIPYTYKIRKNVTELRDLSIMHPMHQIKVSDFYMNYYGMILAQCQKSSWSLRHPSAVATHFVEKRRAKKKENGKKGSVESISSGFEKVSKTASSFFAYKKFSLLYKFFESTEFHQLEKKYNLLLKLDIAQCFGRIYTHTIEWAVKSKDYAKKNITNKSRQTFEKQFDALMQNSNYAETSGIIIGPEISRIFAEIILQEIDLDIEAMLLKDPHPIRCGIDYEIRRYVDDYFIFSNQQENLISIQSCISECLKPYRLSLNESKSSCVTRPFTSNETLARIEIATKISEIFKATLKTETKTNDGKTKVIFTPTRCNSDEQFANKTIKSIKNILKLHNTSFETTSNYTLSTIRTLTYRYIKKIHPLEKTPAQKEWITNFLLGIIEVLFFFYACSPKVRQTYITSEILILIINYANNSEGTCKERLYTKISKEIILATNTKSQQRHQDNIEILNLLIILEQLGESYMHDPYTLKNSLGVYDTDGNFEIPKNFGYFNIVTTLYLIKTRMAYNEIKEKIIHHINELFTTNNDWNMKSELVMLLLDCISCPYLSEDQKIIMAKNCLRHKSMDDLKKRAVDFINLTKDSTWFFDWSSKIDLSDALERKELRTPY